jgi:hypothetical protein
MRKNPEKAKDPILYTKWQRMSKRESVESSWKTSYEKFRRWSHRNGYEPSLYLVRKDPSKGWTSTNLKWSETKPGPTPEIKHNPWGLEEMSLSKAAKRFAICSRATVRRRIYQGWKIEEALITPGAK